MNNKIGQSGGAVAPTSSGSQKFGDIFNASLASKPMASKVKPLNSVLGSLAKKDDNFGVQKLSDNTAPITSNRDARDSGVRKTYAFKNI